VHLAWTLALAGELGAELAIGLHRVGERAHPAAVGERERLALVDEFALRVLDAQLERRAEGAGAALGAGAVDALQRRAGVGTLLGGALMPRRADAADGRARLVDRLEVRALARGADGAGAALAEGAVRGRRCVAEALARRGRAFDTVGEGARAAGGDEQQQRTPSRH